MGPLSREELRAVLRPFGEAAPLPRSAFVDPAVLAFEERFLLSPAWVPVAHVSDFERPGDWVRAPIRNENLVVFRGADISISAVHAVCTHRGALLCDGEKGRLPGLALRCPYHAWTYGTDGTLLEAPGASGASGASGANSGAATPGGGPGAGGSAPGRWEPGLARARVEVRAGVVFVNLDGRAAPLEESWRGGPPWLAAENLPPLARARRTDHVVQANWKVVVGNFQESHHFPAVHPALEERTPWARSTSIARSDAWLGGTMEIAQPFETVSWSGKRRGRPFVAAPGDRGRVLDAFVFPLWMTSLQPDYLLTYRLAPLAVDSTLVVAEIHVHPGALARGVDLDDVFGFWDVTNAEDRAVCELQQRGLACRHAGPSSYATSEDGLHAFERIVAERCLAALEMEGTE